jgi:hypothetical protein
MSVSGLSIYSTIYSTDIGFLLFSTWPLLVSYIVKDILAEIVPYCKR